MRVDGIDFSYGAMVRQFRNTYESGKALYEQIDLIRELIIQLSIEKEALYTMNTAELMAQVCATSIVTGVSFYYDFEGTCEQITKVWDKIQKNKEEQKAQET